MEYHQGTMLARPGAHHRARSAAAAAAAGEWLRPLPCSDCTMRDMKLPFGAQVRVTHGSGLESNRTGRLLHPGDPRGRAARQLGYAGRYKPFDRRTEAVVLGDDGTPFTMFKSRLEGV
jgi:hypothetical protein